MEHKRFSSGLKLNSGQGSTDNNSKPPVKRQDSVSSLSKYSLGSDEGKIVEVEDSFQNSDEYEEEDEERKDDGRVPEQNNPSSSSEEVVHWSMLGGNAQNISKLVIKKSEKSIRASARAKKENAR